MTDWKNHLKIGISLNILFIISYVIYTRHTDLDWALVLSLAVITPLVPDLDHPLCKLTKIAIGWGLAIAVFGIIFKSYFFISMGVFGALGFYIVPYFFKHRAFLHSLSFCLLCGLGVFLITDLFTGAFVTFGIYTHLIGDRLFFKWR